MTRDYGEPNCSFNDNGEYVPKGDYFGPYSVCNSTSSVDTCRYRAYRADPGSDNAYNLDIEWFRIMLARLLFVVLFEVYLFL